MRFFKSRTGLGIIATILLLTVFFIRPGAQQLQSRIVNSISLAVGRQVDVSSVHLRLLPQPGFDLENFVIHDDPAFSAEPVMWAQEVTAALRVTSLFRGRLEISRLDVTDPSINLVRNHEGHWNLENLLERTAKTTVAPTSKAKSESRPAFPYIQADGGRINFKFGQEKKAYALGDAEFALWQDSENSWGMRLYAKPLRTDLNLTDTGIVKVSGTWQRAQTLRETPVQFNLQWDHGQLGQITKIAYGSDKGWRGTPKISMAVSGTPADLTVSTDFSLQDFRRYDILEGKDLRLAAQCQAHYSSVGHTLSNLACRAPVGDGAITLEGSISHPTGTRSYDLVWAAQNVPLQALAAAARHAKKNIPEDLAASGKVDANFTMHREEMTEIEWQGGGEFQGVHLASKLTKTDLALGRIPFTVSSGVSKPGAGGRIAARAARTLPTGQVDAAVDIGPFDVALGRPLPLVVRATISHSGYNMIVQGDAQVQRLLQVARTMGFPAPRLAADGVAKIDLQVAGVWTGFAPLRATGKAQLHSVRAEVRGWDAPLQITSANLILAQDQINVQDLTASTPGSSWNGSVTLPRECASPAGCPIRFDLHVDEIATERLNLLLNSRPGTRPWYRFLSRTPQPGPAYLATLRATGRFSAHRVVIKKLVADDVSASVTLADGKLQMTDVRGDVLGGKHVGEWTADFTGKMPSYTGSGTFQQIALQQLADTMQDGWITGTANATYHVSASGFSVTELFSSADGALKVGVRDGVLPHIALSGTAEPLTIHRFDGQIMLHDGKFEVQAGKLETLGGIYQVSGTASLGRTINMKLARDGAQGFSITGTLAAPRVAAVTAPETQAVLKP